MEESKLQGFRLMPWVEEVKERMCGVITWSTIRRAYMYDIINAERLNLIGKCPHNVIYDTWGPIYDERHCYTCDTGLGFI